MPTLERTEYPLLIFQTQLKDPVARKRRLRNRRGGEAANEDQKKVGFTLSMNHGLSNKDIRRRVCPHSLRIHGLTKA